MNNIITELQARGVIIPAPQQIYVEKDVLPSNIEQGVTLLPGITLQGSKTLLGKNSILGPNGVYSNVRCGTGVKLGSGYYDNCVFLDGARVRSGAEIRGGTLFMEASEAAHTVGCKMTILGIKVVLGSLLNFCDVFITGGTEEPFGFTEIGSGAVHYNFTPNGLKFASLVGPGVPGEMFGLFPKTFIGGQTQIIAPNIIGTQVLIPAGTAVRNCIPDGCLSIEAPLKATQKPYHPSLITSVKEKFWITAMLVSHYHALYYYFMEVRNKFAIKTKNIFLQKLLLEAGDMILANIQERFHWIFDQKEQGQKADLFAKLPLSLELHKKELAKASGNAILFYLKQIQEHESLLSHKEILEHKFLAPCSTLPEQKDFLEMLDMELSCGSFSSYLDFISRFPEQGKRKGQKWLSALVEKKMEEIKEILKSSESFAPIVVESKKNTQEFLPYFSRFQNLYKQNKFLFDGNWNSPQMGLLNGDLHPYTDLQIPAWQLWAIKPEEVSQEKMSALLDILEKWPYPALIHWPYLLSLASKVNDSEITEETIKRACFCFHGTDGLRGPTFVPRKPLSLMESICHFLEKHEITPEFFQALARNTACAFEIFYGKKIDSVLVGCDPRDIYCDDPRHQRIFYQSVVDGLLSTVKQVHDLGVVPIPCMPYALAYYDCQDNSIQASLAVYKSASHNPASQDGLKIFVKSYNNQGSVTYGKAPLELEFTIAALLYKEALKGPQTKEKGIYHKAEKMGGEILTRTMLDTRNLPDAKSIAFVVADLANGAFSAPSYQDMLREILQSMGIESFFFVGNHPDGKNINSNQGKERVGAAHLENTYKITHSDLEEGGKFSGFPCLKALMDFSQQNLEKMKNGYTAWAILVDGDGDRSYVVMYNPVHDYLQVIDGDEALFYQAHALAQTQNLHLLHNLAFTVESSVPFINALIKDLKKYSQVQFLLSEDTPVAPDKINLKLCPVGDKHILRQQCMGAESSGHIVKPYYVIASDLHTRHKVFTGNGILSSLYTIAAISSALHREQETPFLEKIQKILSPYPIPHNDLLYIYFVNKKLWYRNSELWQQVYNFVIEACKPYVLQEVLFRDEKDTLYFLCMDESDNILFSILARPSGTENKFGIKFFGDSTQKTFFEKITESLFPQIAQSMKETKNSLCQDEQKILQYLAKNPHKAISLEELKAYLGISDTGAQNAYFMSIVEALSDKCQKMAFYDGKSLKIKDRGKNFLF